MHPRRDSKVFAGDRLRRLRDGRGMGQGALARAVGVSPSYLSQIEADLRPIPAALRRRIAAVFGVADSHFAADGDERLAASLLEATADPVFGQGAVSPEEARACVRAAPQAAERFITLYRAYVALDEQMQTRREPHAGPDAVTPHFGYDEVRDWVQSHNNHFDGLDHAAERLAEAGGFTGPTLREDLARCLRDRHGITVVDTPALLAQGTVWRLQRGSRTLLLAEEAAVSSQVFWMAHVVGLLEQRGAIAALVRGSGLSSPWRGPWRGWAWATTSPAR